jgi:hypothetical protein
MSDPAEADIHVGHGNALMLEGRAAEAEAAYRAALACNPDHVPARNNLGNALRALGRHAEALAEYRRVLALRPDQFGTQNNVASALLALHRPIEAEPWLRRVLAEMPDYAEAANNLGGALLAQDRLEEAATWFERACAQDPALVQARFGLAMARLGMGDFAAGWAEYECRWHDPRFLAEFAPPDLPRWHGEALAGRRILLTAEQGLGDTIQFARFAPVVAARGGDVVLAVQSSLVTLLRDLAPTVIALDETPPDCALHCPLMSLPLALGTTLATLPAPSLTPDPALVHRWRGRLGPARGPRIGLALSGSAEHSDDALRSIPASAFASLFAVRGVEFHLLQTEIRDHDRPALAGVRLHDAALTDFADTAALAALMELVISVDTSVAHLAASLGRPTWVLLPFAADWRWLRQRSDSPWYPAAQLFRQPAPGDWNATLQNVTTALHRRFGL